MVGRQAAALGLPHAILTWASGESRAASLQARARAARYDLMAAYCHAHDIQALVTAHHLDDQAETFLMRLKRGSGLDGLAAIPERGAWAGIAVLRPLLDVQKARLVATLREADVRFVCDPSNHDPRFERARVRAKPGRAVAARIDARGSGAFGAALAAGARGAGRRGARLPRRAQRDERGGLCIDRYGGTGSGAAGDRVAGSGAIDRRGGRRRDSVAARQARVPARGLGGASRQGAYARPLPHRADVRPARRLPRGQRQRAARDGAFARACGHFGTIAFGSSFRPMRPSRSWSGRSASPGWRELETALGTGRVAAAACRPDLAGLLARGDSLGTSKAWSEAQSSLARALRAARPLSAQAEGRGTANRSTR